MAYRDNTGNEWGSKEEANYQTAVNQSQGVGAGRGSVYTGPGGGSSSSGDIMSSALDSVYGGMSNALKQKSAENRARTAALTDIFNEGMDLFENGDYDGALKKFEYAYRLETNDGCRIMIGRCYREKKDYPKALEIFQEQIWTSHLQDKAEAYYWRGTTYGAANKYKKAVSDYNYALLYKIDDCFLPALYHHRGVNYANIGRWTKTEKDLKKAAEYGDHPCAVEARELLQKHAEDFRKCEAAEKEKFNADLKAAQSGGAQEWYNLGIDYDEEIGTAINPEEARRLITKAAEQGHNEAYKWLQEHQEEANVKSLKKYRLIGAVFFAVIYGILPGFGFIRIIVGALFGLVVGSTPEFFTKHTIMLMGIGGALSTLIGVFQKTGSFTLFIYMVAGTIVGAIVGAIISKIFDIDVNDVSVKVKKSATPQPQEERTEETAKSEGTTLEMDAQYRTRYDKAKNLYDSSKKSDKKEAFSIFEELAKAGYAPAQYYLGQCYFLSWGVKEDFDKAVEWYLKAAEQGHALAQCEIATQYEYGMSGFPKDIHKAAEWRRKAAANGNKYAQEWLEETVY